jgi:hypothetical protein
MTIKNMEANNCPERQTADRKRINGKKGEKEEKDRKLGRSIKHKKLQEIWPGQWNVRADTESVKRVLSNP